MKGARFLLLQAFSDVCFFVAPVTKTLSVANRPPEYWTGQKKLNSNCHFGQKIKEKNPCEGKLVRVYFCKQLIRTTAAGAEKLQPSWIRTSLLISFLSVIDPIADRSLYPDDPVKCFLRVFGVKSIRHRQVPSATCGDVMRPQRADTQMLEEMNKWNLANFFFLLQLYFCIKMCNIQRIFELRWPVQNIFHENKCVLSCFLQRTVLCEHIAPFFFGHLFSTVTFWRYMYHGRHLENFVFVVNLSESFSSFHCRIPWTWKITLRTENLDSMSCIQQNSVCLIYIPVCILLLHPGKMNYLSLITATKTRARVFFISVGIQTSNSKPSSLCWQTCSKVGVVGDWIGPRSKFKNQNICTIQSPWPQQIRQKVWKKHCCFFDKQFLLSINATKTTDTRETRDESFFSSSVGPNHRNCKNTQIALQQYTGR